jgi:hypothetical protein
MRHTGVLGVLALGLALVASPASAKLKIDLPTIVVTNIDGYVPAPAGMGLNGPVSKEQYIQLSGNSTRVRDAIKGRSLRIYARTFARMDGGVAVFMGFQLDRPEAAKRFLAGAQEGLKANHLPVTPVPGIPGAIRTTQPPTSDVPVPREQVLFRSGRLGFSVSVLVTPTQTDPGGEVVRLARVQATNVPHDVASEKDITESSLYKSAPLILLILVVAIVLLIISRRRRRRTPAEAATAVTPPGDAPS